MAYRGNWISRMPKDLGKLWGKVAIVLIVLMPVLFVVGCASGGLGAFGGGWTWQAATFAFWEQFFCIAVSIGLMILFREKLNIQNRFTKALSEFLWCLPSAHTSLFGYCPAKSADTVVTKIRCSEPNCSYVMLWNSLFDS